MAGVCMRASFCCSLSESVDKHGEGKGVRTGGGPVAGGHPGRSAP